MYLVRVITGCPSIGSWDKVCNLVWCLEPTNRKQVLVGTSLHQGSVPLIRQWLINPLGVIPDVTAPCFVRISQVLPFLQSKVHIVLQCTNLLALRLILTLVWAIFNDKSLRSISIFYCHLALCHQKYHQLVSSEVSVKRPETEDAQLNENLVCIYYIQHSHTRSPLFIWNFV